LHFRWPPLVKQPLRRSIVRPPRGERGEQLGHAFDERLRAADVCRQGPVPNDIAKEPGVGSVVPVQLAQREAAPDSKPAKTLARIREDTAALTSIVNELLLAATGAAQEPPAEPTDLADVAVSVAEGMQQIARNQGVSIVARTEVRPLARIDEGSLRRAVLALADNALAHTPSGGAITITTALERHQAVITVSDTGTGIDGVDQARIFERFVRTHGWHGTRRSFGIGLALVRDIVSSAGGTVEIARTGPDGTTMRIALPPAGNGIPSRRVAL
jgi:signal transduction histidine kinase